MGPRVRQPRRVAARAAGATRASVAIRILRDIRPTRFGRFVRVPERAAAGDVEEASGPTRRRPSPARPPGPRAAACAARPAAAEHGDRARADAQAGRAAGALGGRALLGRVRPRSDARDPRAGGRGGAQLLAADRGDDRLPDARGGRVLSPDDPRVPAWRRLLHRRQRQPRANSGSRRGGGLDDGLHPHGRRLGRLRASRRSPRRSPRSPPMRCRSGWS